MTLVLVLICRTIITYLFLILLICLIKKDHNKDIVILNKLSILLTLILSCNVIINYKENIILLLIPIIIIFILRELASTIYYKHKKIRNYFEKDPIILVRNGKVYFKNLLEYNYNIDTLLKQIKKRNIYSLQDIKYIFLEANGELSIFPYDNKKYEMYPSPIILNSKINEEVLKDVNLKEKDVKEMLKKENIKLEDIYYGILKNRRIYIINNKDLL